MPQFIPIIFSAFEGYITWTTAFELIALSLFATQLQKDLAKDPTQMTSNTTAEYSGTVEPRRIVYGQIGVSGMNSIPPWNSGSGSNPGIFLHQDLVLAGHEVDTVGDVFFNQALIPSKDINDAVYSLPNITGGPYAGYAIIRRYAGAAGQAVDPFLTANFFTQCPSTSTGTGIAHVALTYVYNPGVFTGGKPEVRVSVAGKKCYDPRLDSSPGANPTTGTYIKWTANPALCIVDYLLDTGLGVGEAATRIDWTAAVAAANACDEVCSVPGVGSLTGQVSGAGAVSISGDVVTKTAGTSAWGEASARASPTSRMSARTLSLAHPSMMGLNSDPATDAHYTSIDYAWYATGSGGSGKWEIYESGVQILTTAVPCATTDCCEITYDGQNVIYWLNGKIWRTVRVPTANVSLSFDSALYEVGSSFQVNVQKRYTCNIVLDSTANWEDNLKALAGSMLGSVLYSGGKWLLSAGKYYAPSFVIGDDDIIGAMTNRTAIAYADRYNAVRGQFYDKANLYQPIEFPAQRVSADETADGEGPLYRELNQPTCIDQYEAQRNAIILQRKSRRKKLWTLEGAYSLYGIRPGEFGTLNIAELGYVSQVVRCTGWKLNPKTMTHSIILEEANSADWNDPATSFYQTMGTATPIAPTGFVAQPLTSFTATPAAGGITFAWALPAPWYPELSVELLEASANNIAGAAVIWIGSNTGAFIQRGDTALRYYWIRVRNVRGNTLSVTTPSGPTAGLPAAALITGQGSWTPNMTASTMAQFGAGRFVKVAGATAYDAQVYSSEAYAQCFVSFQFDTSLGSGQVAVGLNNAPSALADFSDIEHCWFVNSTPTVAIYENGSSVYSGGALVAGETLSITYDGYMARYFRNGVLVYASQDPNRIFSLDSSFRVPNASAVTALNFGPLSTLVPSGKNLIDSAVWKVGTSGAQGNFTDVAATASSIVLGGVGGEPLGPYYTPEPLWKGIGFSNTQPAGGWDDSLDIKGVDPTKTYRSTAWIRYSGPNSGTIYHGCSGSATADVPTGAANSNPYFLAQTIGSGGLVPDKWYLSVGFVHGSGYGTTQMNTGGLYDPQTGQKLFALPDFKQLAGNTTQEHRAFNYYAATSSTLFYGCRPRFEVVDGTEPSILALLGIVGSGVMAANAATEVYSQHTTSSAIAPSGHGISQLVVFPVTFGAGQGGSVVVTVTFSATLTTSGGSAPVYQFQAAWNDDYAGVGTWSTPYVTGPAADTAGLTKQFALQGTFTHTPAAAPISVAAALQLAFSSGTAWTINLADLIIQIEWVKK